MRENRKKSGKSGVGWREVPLAMFDEPRDLRRYDQQIRTALERRLILSAMLILAAGAAIAWVVR